jgi:5-methyltetrahydropteroyltriglutamate--homocysteine methyltransferase
VSASPFRADQVGSYLRPPQLLHARAAFQQGQLERAQLREAEDTAVLQVLDLQRQVGIDVCTDGEYRRGGWTGGLPQAVEGFEEPDEPDRESPISMRWRGEHLDLLRGQGRAALAGTDEPAVAVARAGMAAFSGVIASKLRAKGRIYGEDSAFLKQHARGPFKITVTSPTWYLRQYRHGVSDRVYPTPADALRDLQAITQNEIRSLVVDDRVDYLQVDSIRYVFDFTDDERRQAWHARGIDPDQAIEENITADNAVLEGIPRDGVTFGLHMCRGNNRSNYFAAGGYERIAEKAFPALNFDRFLLEYDTDRAGGFEPLRFVPPGKTVVLGLISTKVAQLESQDQLLRRIDEAARYVPMQNLALSPQCGFASVLQGNAITWDDQRRKLELLVDTARKAWSR